jgi:diguanylate cyclase (GGDEF)-like protein
LSKSRPPTDFPEERTAVLQVADLLAPQPESQRDRHILVQVKGGSLGQVIALQGGELVIGRVRGVDVFIPDAGVSRRHARVFFEAERYVVEDLGSANGTFVHGERVARKVLDDGDIIQIAPSVAFRYSITDADQQGVLQHLYEASVRDALTGAYNREYFDTRLASELSYSRRHAAEMSLVMLDIDHFKRINDTFGHLAGDAVLVRTVEAVRGMLRIEDVFCRYGGEEFIIILRTTNLEAARQVAERVRRSIEAMVIDYEGHILHITVSLGCASLADCPPDGPADLVAVVDRRLYAAKHGGRNRVVAQG